MRTDFLESERKYLKIRMELKLTNQSVQGSKFKVPSSGKTNFERKNFERTN